MKKFFIGQPQSEFEVVNESAIEQSHSQTNRQISHIDAAHESMLQEQSSLSQSGLECDKIRLQRIQKERQHKQTELDALFCSPKQPECQLLCTSALSDSSCLVVTSQADDSSKVTDTFARGFLRENQQTVDGVG